MSLRLAGFVGASFREHFLESVAKTRPVPDVPPGRACRTGPETRTDLPAGLLLVEAEGPHL
jgi:hypothetical protein